MGRAEFDPILEYRIIKNWLKLEDKASQKDMASQKTGQV